jgi:Transcriptional Coactivator p15 (PC4)
MAQQATQDVVLGAITRQRCEQIRVTVRRRHGHRVLDLRVFVQTDLGEWVPTQRGVSLSEKDWKELRTILAKLKGGQAGVDKTPT